MKNYHLYVAWALLHGRLALDLAPSGMQSFFNPLLDLPYFLLGVGPLSHLPRLLAGVQGLWYGGVIFVLLKITVRLSILRKRTFGVMDLAALFIGATGTMVISQAGMSSNEVALALFILSSVYQLLFLCGPCEVSKPIPRVLLAGVLCGVAAGLKPTAVIYPPALGLALLVALRGRANAWRMALLFASSAFFGFMLVYGWWGWQLYKLTGNPIFPMFNQLFHSTWVPAASETDRGFMPRNLNQWLFYPFYWIKLNHSLVTELDFADGRYALEMIAVPVVIVKSWLMRRDSAENTKATQLLAVFVLFGYIFWLGLFSILRYAIPLEALSGLLIMVALQPPAVGDYASPTLQRLPAPIMVGLLLILVAFTRYPSWGRAPYAGVAFDIHPPKIERNSLVVVVGQPAAYIIPFLNDAQSSRYASLTWFYRSAKGYQFANLVHERISDHKGMMYALLRDNAGEDMKSLRRILLDVKFVNCTPVESNFEMGPQGQDISAGLRICELKHS